MVNIVFLWILQKLWPSPDLLNEEGQPDLQINKREIARPPAPVSIKLDTTELLLVNGLGSSEKIPN